jgi:hypothetical protein
MEIACVGIGRCWHFESNVEIRNKSIVVRPFDERIFRVASKQKSIIHRLCVASNSAQCMLTDGWVGFTHHSEGKRGNHTFGSVWRLHQWARTRSGHVHLNVMKFRLAKIEENKPFKKLSFTLAEARIFQSYNVRR